VFILRLRDGNYLKKNPTARVPFWTVDCDVEPCPTILAAGIRNTHVSGHEIEYDGEPPVSKRNVSSDLPLAEKPPYRVPLVSEIEKVPWNGFTVVSTFAGAGGSSTGYRMAGYRVLLANEFVPIAQESYAANKAPHTIVEGRDIKEISVEDVLFRTGLEVGELDVFDGSPPCQAFSTAGKREKGWGEDKVYEHGAAQKNEELFWEYIRLLRGLQPRTFVAENVTGLVKGAAKGMFLEILRDLKASGYAVEARKLDAQWLGVPQCRERIIFVGVRNDLAAKGFKPAFPEPLAYRYSVRDALPHLGVGSEGKQSNHFSIRQNSNAPHDRKGESRSLEEPAPTLLARRANLEVVETKLVTNSQFEERLVSIENPSPTIMAGGSGKTSGHIIERSIEEGLSIEGQAIGEEWDRLNPGQQSDKYFSLVKADPAKPSPTITAAGGQNAGIATVVHPTEKRKFTIAEVRRLCGFPDDFVLKGTYGQQWERLGNSVPPVMMSHVAAAIRDKILIPWRDQCAKQQQKDSGLRSKSVAAMNAGRGKQQRARKATRRAGQVGEVKRLRARRKSRSEIAARVEGTSLLRQPAVLQPEASVRGNAS
jgi:DNA (cytosine-5)-methyltransferase 1